MIKSINLAKVTILRTAKETTVELAGCTPDIVDQDRDEMLRRAEAIDLSPGLFWDWLNLFFFQLPSGSFALGRLVPISVHAKSKDEERFQVQYLSIPAETLIAFGNNPVLLYQNLLNAGNFSCFLNPQNILQPIEPGPIQWTIDISLLKGMAVNPGSDALTVLLESILDSIETIFTGSVSAVHVVLALMNLLPIPWRPELTFAVGLNFNDQVDFRLRGIDRKNSFLIETLKSGSVPFFDLDEITQNQRTYHLMEGWALYIREALQQGAFSLVAHHVFSHWKSYRNKNDFYETTMPVEEVNRLGFQYLENLRARFPKQNEQAQSTSDESSSSIDNPLLLETELSYPGHDSNKLSYEQPLATMNEKNRIFSPYQRLFALWPQYRNDFLLLDSLIAHALKFEPESLEKLRQTWSDLSQKLNDDVLWAVREEYIHYVQTALVEDKPLSTPLQQSLFSLEILDILVN